MKTISKISLILFVSILVIQCTTTESQLTQHWAAYKTAMVHGDIPTAIVEVNSIYSLDTNSQSVLDTMMRLYFVMGNHISSYNVATKIEDKQSIHKNILAESSLQLGKAEEAKALMIDIEDTDSLGLSLNSKYKLATLYFNDKEYAEALAVLGKIVEDDKSLEQATRISGDNAVTQNVSLYAASHNFAGFVFMELNEFDTAEGHFNEALRVQPDFQLVKNNLAQLEAAKEAAEN